MTVWRMMGAALLLASACRGPAGPDVAAVVRNEIAHVVATGQGAVTCNPHKGGAIVSYGCMQKFTPGDDGARVAIVSIAVTPAKGPAATKASPATGGFFGPGGAGFKLHRRTRDGVYDVTVDNFSTGIPNDEAEYLPDPDALLDRVVAAYDARR